MTKSAAPDPLAVHHVAERLRQATSAHIGRPVAILLEGRVAMAPTVRSPIAESAVITGAFTEAEARRIAEGISRR